MLLLSNCVLLVLVNVCFGVRDGADIFFKTNLDEMQDVPLVFTKPPPSWIKGTLIRNGLGRFEVGGRKYENALDAFGKLSSWKFSGNGSAFFSTRMIYSNSYNQSLAANDIAPFLVLDRVDPPFNVVQELESFKNGPDNTNVNVFNFGEDFVVLSDYWNVYQIDAITLETIRGIKPPVPNATQIEYPIVLSSAHPLPEQGTSNHLTFVSIAPAIPELKGKIMFHRATSAGGREILSTIEVDKASYMHSFAVTENYAVLLAVPFFVDPLGMLKDFRPLDAFEWDPLDVTMMYVINLKTGAVQSLKTENMFFLHVANAYESNIFGNEIIIDVCTFKNTSGLHDMALSKLHNPAERAHTSTPILKRYTLDLKGENVNVHTFPPSTKGDFVNRFDFPTINENYRSKQYCYIYGIAYNYDGTDMLHMALVKKDVCTGKNDLTWKSPGMFFNEAIFVADPKGTEEDDGMLIMPILDTATQATNITMFNAKDLSIVSTARLPTSNPFGTHGHFFDNVY